MQISSRAITLLFATIVAATLGGCAATHGDTHSHLGASASDLKSMCESHRKMMSGKSSAEHQAMMHERMKLMSPEMRHGRRGWRRAILGSGAVQIVRDAPVSVLVVPEPHVET